MVKTIGSEIDEDQHPETNERPKRAESSELLGKWVNLGAKARQWSPTLQLRAAGAQNEEEKRGSERCQPETASSPAFAVLYFSCWDRGRPLGSVPLESEAGPVTRGSRWLGHKWGFWYPSWAAEVLYRPTRTESH